MKKLISSHNLHKLAKIGWAIARTFLIFILSYIIFYPLLQTISKAFMPVEDYSDPSIIWVPKRLTLTNIKAALEGLEYWRTLGRTAILCIGCAVIQVFSSAMIGYGFARFRFKLRGPLFALVILTVVVPTQLIFIPMMMQYRFFDFFGISRVIALFTGESYTNYTVNLLNNYATFFLPSALGVGVRSGLFIYIYRQFFRNIPRELEEAAKIDGCGPWSTFIRVMLPNAKNSAITVFLFSVVWHWNETIMTNSFFTDKMMAVRVKNIADSINNLVDSGYFTANGRNLQAQQGVAYASLILFLLPPLILYIFTQKYFVEGVETSGIKG